MNPQRGKSDSLIPREATMPTCPACHQILSFIIEKLDEHYWQAYCTNDVCGSYGPLYPDDARLNDQER